MQTDTRARALIQNEHIQLTTIEVALHTLLVLIRALTNHGLTVGGPLDIGVTPGQLAHAVALRAKTLDDMVEGRDKHVTRHSPYLIAQLIVSLLSCLAKFVGLDGIMGHSLTRFHGVLHHGVQTAKKAHSKRRLFDLIAYGKLLIRALHRALQCNDRVPARFYLGVDSVNDGVSFQRQHKLLGVVIGLARKGHVSDTQLICSLLNTRLAHCHGYIIPRLLDEWLDKSLLKLND